MESRKIKINGILFSFFRFEKTEKRKRKRDGELIKQ